MDYWGGRWVRKAGQGISGEKRFPEKDKLKVTYGHYRVEKERLLPLRRSNREKMQGFCPLLDLQ